MQNNIIKALFYKLLSLENVYQNFKIRDWCREKIKKKKNRERERKK